MSLVLVDEEVRAVLGVGMDEVSVEQLYEPVASASIGIWRVRGGDRSAVLNLAQTANPTRS